ncbi:hypothetical protein Q3H58_004698 [Pseudomonas psychrotolerans]|nr:hypothetical protein [Pseudomonas psychrotolerans]
MAPNTFQTAARMPETGWKIRFFQISALTVGMMKKGEIKSTRTMPRPKNSLASSSAEISTPKTTLIANTLPTSSRVLVMPGQKPASVTKYSKFSRPTKPCSPG